MSELPAAVVSHLCSHKLIKVIDRSDDEPWSHLAVCMCGFVGHSVAVYDHLLQAGDLGVHFSKATIVNAASTETPIFGVLTVNGHKMPGRMIIEGLGTRG